MCVSPELNFMITTPVFQLYPWSQVVIDHKSQATIILSLYIYIATYIINVQQYQSM